MKALLFPFLLISAGVSAQKTDKQPPLLPKTDTLKILKQGKLEVLSVEKLNATSKKEYKDLYKILTVKPDTSLYLALKEPKIDTSKYKILNVIIPEKQKPEEKKIIPSK